MLFLFIFVGLFFKCTENEYSDARGNVQNYTCFSEGDGNSERACFQVVRFEIKIGLVRVCNAERRQHVKAGQRCQMMIV